jgi:hypothetical protein
MTEDISGGTEKCHGTPISRRRLTRRYRFRDRVRIQRSAQVKGIFQFQADQTEVGNEPIFVEM